MGRHLHAEAVRRVDHRVDFPGHHQCLSKTAAVCGYPAGYRYLDPLGPGGDLRARPFHQLVRSAEFLSALLF